MNPALDRSDTASKITIKQLMGWADTQTVTRFIDLLSANKPLQSHEEAACIATSASEMALFLETWATGVRHSPVQIDPQCFGGLAEFLLLLRVMLRRIEQWEEIQHVRIKKAGEAQ